MATSLRIRNSTLLLTRFLNSATLPRPRWLQTVAYEELRANPEKPYTSTAVFIHGFLGSSRNWRSFSRNLLASLSNSSPSSSTRARLSCFLFFFFLFVTLNRISFTDFLSVQIGGRWCWICGTTGNRRRENWIHLTILNLRPKIWPIWWRLKAGLGLRLS